MGKARRTPRRPAGSTPWMARRSGCSSPSNRKTARELAPRTAVTALSAMVSNTGWTSVGELEMTRRISPVAVCCSRVSVRSRLRASSSLNRRTFSMAMTAWSAKVLRSAICRSENGPARAPHASRDRRSACPRAASARTGRSGSRRRRLRRDLVSGLGVDRPGCGRRRASGSRGRSPLRTARSHRERRSQRWRRPPESRLRAPRCERARRRSGKTQQTLRRTAARALRRWCRRPAGRRSASSR